MQVRMLLIRAFALGALVLSIPCAGQASSEPSQGPFEPVLRELWNRGSERFHRQWLIAGPVAAQVASTVDPLQLEPAAGEQLTARDPGVKWATQVSWSDVTDVNTGASRAPETDGRSVDRFVFVAGTLSNSSPGPAELAIGSERAYSVWLNGKLVHSRNTAEAFSPDTDRVPVELRAGDNQLLLRFHETSAGPSPFSLRAVPPGAALKKVDEITPSLVASSDQSLAVRTHLAAEKDAAPVSLEIIAAGGEVVARQSAPRGDVIEFESKSWRDGAYDIRVSTQNAWKEPQVRYLTWYKGDPIAAVRRLIAAADAAKDDVQGDHVRMLAAMAKDRLGGSIEKATAAAWRLVHSPLMEFEELQLEAQSRPARLRASGFVRIAYDDAVDGSTQYCRAYLPGDYSAAKQWPLILSLHGYNPANPEYVDWWSVDTRHHPIAESKGTIYIEPHGRGNAQYLGIGDRDVMRCLDEAERRFSVDADRVYLTGESMGGHGTWAIVTRHPDVFAAAAPVFGGWDFRITNVNSLVNPPAPATALEAFWFERGSSFANAENLLHVPLLVIHGDADPAVHVANSRHAVQLLQRWGYDIRYHEMPGWAHEDLGQQATIADWLLSHRRVAAPATVRLRSTDLAGASAYWVRVRAFQNPSEVIRVVAEVLQPGLVRIDSTNVAALTLDLPAALRGSAKQLRVVWNGQPHELNAANGGELGSMPSNSKLSKRAGLEGPLPAVIATPFAVVVGTTSSDPRMREIIQARADFFAQQWLTWQHQPLRMLKDTEVTAEHEKAYSLVLLGGADANAITRKLAKQLPFEASRNGIVVDGRSWKVKDSVLQALYPSPLAADRYVYVITATSPEGMYFWKPQLVHFAFGYPVTMSDWIIQDGRRPPPGTQNAAVANVAAGVFDASWRRKDQWSVMRDDKSTANWTLRRAPPKDFVPSQEALQAIAGRYELFPGTTVLFRPEGNRLVAELPDGSSITLATESDSIFIVPQTGDAVEFIRDPSGKVSGASVENQGSMISAKRLP
jgi:poly(3-hydroxybutyrate) depolymerase